MKVLICDDDELFLSELKKLISEFFKQKKYTNVEIVCYQQGECALRECSDADIAFLDVEMEGVSGIHVGRKLKEINPDLLVFLVTSFGEYLDEAMRFALIGPKVELCWREMKLSNEFTSLVRTYQKLISEKIELSKIYKKPNFTCL